MLKRLTALLLLAAVLAYSAEAVLGALRDGEVHHESFAAAASHAGHGQGDHGHEDGPLGHPHGPGHQHGTSADHCTHQHTATPSGGLVPTLLAERGGDLPPEPADLLGRSLAAPFRPPRA